jgi:OPT family oligopeptide transporter
MSFYPADLHGIDTHGSNGSENTIVGEISTSPSTTSPDDSSQETVFGFDDRDKTSPTATSEFDNEKGTPENISDEEKNREEVVDPTGDDNPLLKDIPWHVRRVVSLHDDTTLPTITFRYIVLSLVFVIPGAFLQQMVCYRTTFAPYSIFFVQIGSNYAGEWLAATLPAWEVKVPFTKWSFNLNPGPFSVKEHVLVVICAASGATYNLAYGPISIAELFFGHKLNPAVAIFFMWTVVWTGYSYAAIARQFLVYDPQYPWFQALCQTALFETQKKQRENPSPISRRQMMVFFLVLLGVFVWQFLPEFVFPMLGSLSFLCWVAPHNPVANFVGAGLGGLGFLNLSLDWSNVGNLSQMGSLFLTPWWTQVIVFLAFVLNCWILIPASKWGGMTKWNHHLMSNHLFQGNGTSYPILKLITPEASFNETAYAEYGPIYMGAQQLWGMFFDYASFTSALFWMLLFGWPQLKSTWTKFWERNRTGSAVNEQYTDQLNVLMRSYKEVPIWWFIALFMCAFVPTIVILAKGYLYIPLWTYFIALATGAIVVAPLGWLYALSNFQLVSHSPFRNLIVSFCLILSKKLVLTVR